MKKKCKNNFDWKIQIDNTLLFNHIKSHYLAIPKLVKNIFYNNNNYESMNLKYDEKYPNLLYVITDNKWISYDKEYILDTLILEIWSQLYNCYIKLPNIEDYKKTLVCEETFERIEKFMDEFNKFCNHGLNYGLIDQKKNVLNLIILLSKKYHKKLT